jgi:hypothetical protein
MFSEDETVCAATVYSTLRQPELQNKKSDGPGLWVVGWRLRGFRVLVAEAREITARKETTPIRMNVWK